MQQISVSSIVAGRNPRSYFDPAEMAELEASIMAQGVLQPILVRPMGENYQIVAGERRWRAATKAMGTDYQIPVMVREMSDEDADEAALIENIQRANMSPTEEAVAAAKVLARCESNRDDAARRLGWSRTTLDKRLALMNCSTLVQEALNERKITLGHAELLAAVTKDNQDVVLKKLMSMEPLMTLPKFKAMLGNIAKSLDAAIFCKSDCSACPHNSGVQNTLFAEAIAEGHCTNGDCYEAKTEKELETRANALRDEFPVVRIVRVGENDTLLVLRAEGATGVGDEQAQACRACAKFGAAVSGIPGKLGNTYKDLCFDPSCNSKKVAEKIKAEKAASKPPKEASGDGKTPKEASGAKTKPESGKAEKAVTAKATEVQDSTRVKEYRVKVWRDIFRREVSADFERSLMILVALSINGLGRNISGTKLTMAFEKVSGEKITGIDLQQVLLGVSALPIEKRNLLLKSLAASVFDDAEERNIVTVLKFIGADITKYWELNAEFLELLTKSEIEVIADELGLKAHIGADFNKLMVNKKDAIIKGLLGVEGFTYDGKIPKVIKF